MKLVCFWLMCPLQTVKLVKVHTGDQIGSTVGTFERTESPKWRKFLSCCSHCGCNEHCSLYGALAGVSIQTSNDWNTSQTVWTDVCSGRTSCFLHVWADRRSVGGCCITTHGHVCFSAVSLHHDISSADMKIWLPAALTSLQIST